MLKLIGSICIIGSGISMLRQKKKANQQRYEILTNMVLALRNMQEGVRLARAPLPELLNQIAEGYGRETTRFFQRIVFELQDGKDAVSAWKSACLDLPIQKSEQTAISAVAECLRNDEESICKGIELAINTLRNARSEWDKHRAEEEQRTAALYISSAMLLVILLI